jgi:hypothetical protein
MAKYDPKMEKRCAKAIAFFRANPHLKRSKIIAKFLVRD